MTEQERAIKIINECNLTGVQVGNLLGCTWQTISRKKNNINYNKFTSKDIEKLEDYLKQKKEKLNNI